ncbi:hypothetical protein THAOC_03650 [Thalassiosira oceanica]|uniref:Uncharacterized protein n=1 Tax=Thalassiosira oceanica TaxID=159749 RepID=K0TC20_THAOC|nr:hypothetical protein THAOC_03650 [Thalassiosira oceanica]|eukprot:EJK74664.1 hypothetical protein THAOC_03650 [Thalassiosira oceanica]
MNAASAWASGPIRSRSRADIPSARTASAEEGRHKRCPLCRGVVPPSQEQVANYKMVKSLLKHTSDPNYEENARWVKQFEEEYGEDWDGTMIEYESDFVDLPEYVVAAFGMGNLRAVLQWLSKGNLKEKVNAKWEDGGNPGLLFFAVMKKQLDMMSHLLLNGADVNILNVGDASVLTSSCYLADNPLKAVRLLLSWGAELIVNGEPATKELKLLYGHKMSAKGDVEVANLISSVLGGRRCEIVSTPQTPDDLVGKTCIVEEYIKISDQYTVRMEFTNEVLLLDANKLKRRDRTPQDPGYYVECKNNRLTRRDFKSNENCQAFIATVRPARRDPLTETRDLPRPKMLPGHQQPLGVAVDSISALDIAEKRQRLPHQSTCRRASPSMANYFSSSTLPIGPPVSTRYSAGGFTTS